MQSRAEQSSKVVEHVMCASAATHMYTCVKLQLASAPQQVQHIDIATLILIHLGILMVMVLHIYLVITITANLVMHPKPTKVTLAPA